MEEVKNRLYVSNICQRELFLYELMGQFSDGQWENSRPNNHWQFWCNCDVIVAENIGWESGSDKQPKREKYGLTSKDLLEVIEPRMLRLVRWMKAYGTGSCQVLDYLFTCDGQYMGVPDYNGDYYDKVREKLSAYNLDDVVVVANSLVYYNHSRLIQDLQGIKLAMRTRRESLVAV